MKIILMLVLLLITCTSFSKDVYVQGYTRSDGTYVSGHYRSQPNSTINDNFSTEGNINPYTGEAGWLERETEYRGSTEHVFSSGVQTIGEESAISNTDSRMSSNERNWDDDTLLYSLLALGIAVILLFFLISMVIVKPIKNIYKMLKSPREYFIECSEDWSGWLSDSFLIIIMWGTMLMLFFW